MPQILLFFFRALNFQQQEAGSDAYKDWEKRKKCRVENFTAHVC